MFFVLNVCHEIEITPRVFYMILLDCINKDQIKVKRDFIISPESGALSGEMLHVSIIENNKIDAFFRSG